MLEICLGIRMSLFGFQTTNIDKELDLCYSTTFGLKVSITIPARDVIFLTGVR